MRVVFLQSSLVSALVLAGLLGRDGLTGNVPWFGRGDFAFAVDVPDGLGAFNPSGHDRFTLWQIQNPAPG